MSDEHGSHIMVESIYGRTNKLPLVNMVLPDGKDRLSLRVQEARDLAMNLLQAAEAALGDGFMYEFSLGEKNPDDMETKMLAVALMNEYRKFRKKHEPVNLDADDDA